MVLQLFVICKLSCSYFVYAGCYNTAQMLSAENGRFVKKKMGQILRFLIQNTVVYEISVFVFTHNVHLTIDGWLRMGLLPPPPPREFCRHILSCRELKAESFKRCLHSVLRGVSL